MTTITLVQNIADPFDYNDYTYSFDLTSGIQTEDEINDIEVVDIPNNTITITFRSQEWYDYVSTNYESNNWYSITPISTPLYDLLFTGTGISQSDLFYFTAPIGLTFIARNQSTEETLVFTGSWSTGFISLYTIKLLNILN